MEIKEKNTIDIDSLSTLKNQTIEWIIKHKNGILYSITGLMMCFFIGFQLAAKFRGNSQADYIKADASFHRWISSRESNAEFFDVLKKSIAKHPELHAKFDGLIAERLLNGTGAKEAEPYVVPLLERIQKFCPYHAQFASASLQIAQGKLAAALEKAKTLKTALQNDAAIWDSREKSRRFGPILYAYNLLRIAMLEKETGNPGAELEAWEELEKQAGWAGNGSDSQYGDPEAYHLLLQNFQSQSISLLDYIQHRKGELSKF